MFSTFSRLTSRYAAVAALAAAVFTVVAGCSAGTGTADPAATVAVSSSPSTGHAARVVLQFGDHAVLVTLADTATSRELAARLPLRLRVSDAWGQAKSARLSHPLAVDGTTRMLKPRPGGVYYWPDTAALAVYYDDLGQSVPPPGLVQLGTVQTGLDELADADGVVTARVERAHEFR
jgi:hypothetical protein